MLPTQLFPILLRFSVLTAIALPPTAGASLPVAPGEPDGTVSIGLPVLRPGVIRRAPRVDALEWTSAGPTIALFGQVENIAGDNPVIGAIHTVAAHPTNASILYIGSTNGGVWKTVNATAPAPAWTPLTDGQDSLSIGALEFDPTDATHNTLVAGVASYSSFGRLGGVRTGLLRTTDGGASWTPLLAMAGRNISGVAPRGQTIVCSVNTADFFTFDEVGIFRSTDGGASFLQMSVADGSTTGLPGGASYDLASDPTNPARLYTSIVFAPIVGGVSGVYRSDDTGATWTKVSSAAIDAEISDSSTTNIEIAVGNSGQVYVAIINTGRFDALFRSPSGDAGTWVRMDDPATNENGVDIGLNPSGGKGPGVGSAPADLAGGQGTIHFSIRPDPSNANIVYLGGDRQPHANEGIDGDVAFPNSIGATEFTGRLFRGDATLAAGSQFVHLTHSPILPTLGTTGGTASGSAPHADSREMVFDAAGNLIEVDDGGIYKRTSPSTKTGDWFSLIGTGLAVTEMHDIVYDPVSNILISGNQDTGTTYQGTTGSAMWISLTTADGGDVAVAVNPATPGQSIRYSSYQRLGAFLRALFDSDNNLLSYTLPALAPSSEAVPPMEPLFITPMVVNEVDHRRLAFGAGNRFYESLDEGATITDVGPGLTVFGQNAVAYGGRKNGVANPDVLCYAVDDVIYRRVSAGSVAAVSPSFPGFTVTDIVLDPSDYSIVYASDVLSSIYRGVDISGTMTWTDVTGDLAAFGVRALEYIPASQPFILAGGNNGVHRMSVSAPGVWTLLGGGMPNALIWDMDYHAGDDILAVGTMGRGAWTLTGLQGPATPSPTPTPTPSPTASLTPSQTATPTASQTPTPSVTPTATPTASPSPTDSATPTPSPTESATPSPSASPSPSPSQTPTPSPSALPLRTGDVDGDGTIDQEDVGLLGGRLIGIEVLTLEEADRGDFNRDDVLDASDAVGIAGNLD